MSMVHSSRHEELLPAYALGALDGEDLRELEAHLAAGCAECGRQLGLWRKDLEELAASVEPVTPSEAARRRIQRLALDCVKSAPVPASSDSRASSGTPRWAVLAVAASLLIAVGSGWRQARLEQELERLEERSGRMAESLAILISPGARCIHLAGLGPSPAAVGHTFVNIQQGKAVFVGINLPALEPDRTYQLWWLEDGKPVPAGTFGVDEQGTGSATLARVSPAAANRVWAVTVEPKGGVPQPTGETVLKGSAPVPSMSAGLSHDGRKLFLPSPSPREAS